MRSVYWIGEGIRATAMTMPVSEHVVWLTRVAVGDEVRGRGYGSDLLGMVCEDADAEGVTLLLNIEPDPGGLSHDQLRGWYKRYGFDFIDRKASASGMIRVPTPVK